MPKKISPLTDAQCRAARGVPGRSARYFDGDGLYLEVSTSGAKHWRFKYRIQGRENRLSLGRYPAVSLTEARANRTRIQKLLLAGHDPSVERRLDKLRQAAGGGETFRAVASEWMATKRTEWTDTYSLRVDGRLINHVYPWLGEKQIALITTRDLLVVLQELQKSDVFDTARRIRQYMGGIFRFAVATGRASRDLTPELRGALATPVAGRYATTTRPDEVAEILKIIEHHRGTPIVGAALKLAPMLFCRPGELRGMRWAELDLDNALWRIPPERQKLRTKEKRIATEDHLVPLARQALALLQALKPLTGDSEFVFPSFRTRKASISNNTINAALRRLGLPKEFITGHGFRHMASTLLNEAEWPGDVIERQLSHRDRNSVRGRYNLAQYLPLRRQMMQRWADYLDELKIEEGPLSQRLPTVSNE